MKRARERPLDGTRRIIHVDMDCFYAAIEGRDDPSLRGLPLGVGGSSGRGVLTTCNYEARKFGCRSAMPVYRARQLCPQIVVVPVRFEAYRRESLRIREIFARYTRRIEPLSLDEAFLDVTEVPLYAWDIAREIRESIHQLTGLTASAGVAPNKMLAKIASDWRKPDGQFAILPDQVEAFMKDLPVRKLWGVGPKTAEVLEAEQVRTCGDLQSWSPVRLAERFGAKGGAQLYRLCRGEDDRPVETSRRRKSLSNERTLTRNLSTLQDCRAVLADLITELRRDLDRLTGNRPYHKVFVKLKFSDFRVTTCEAPVEGGGAEPWERLLEEAFGRSGEAVRLIGAGVRFPDPSRLGPEQMVFPFVEPSRDR